MSQQDERTQLADTLRNALTNSSLHQEECLDVLMDMATSALLAKGDLAVAGGISKPMNALINQLSEVMGEDDDLPEDIKSKLAELKQRQEKSLVAKPQVLLHAQVVGNHRHNTVVAIQVNAFNGDMVENVEEYASQYVQRVPTAALSLDKFKEASVLLEGEPSEVYEWLLAHEYINQEGVDLSNHTTTSDLD